MTITGQVSPATQGTGSLIFNGSLQSKQVQSQAAAAGSGGVGIAGSLQSTQVLSQAAAPGSATVTISGFEQSEIDPYCDFRCINIYDRGTLSITVNGFSKSVIYGRYSTPSSLASALTSVFNGDAASPVNASVSSATITLTAKTSGASTNYSLSASSQTNDPDIFYDPSFYANPSGATLTGGRDTTYNTIYDSGTVSVTVSGQTKSSSYGQGSTSAGIASALASGFNADPGSPVNASASGSTLYLTSKITGAATNYSLSAITSTGQTQYFSQPSFTTAPSGSTLGGGQDATYNTIYDSGTASITVNSHTNSVSYSQSDNSTAAAIASALAININADAAASVTASASGSTVYLTAKTQGVSTNYGLASAVSTSQGTNFSQPSFSSSASGTTLTGGQDAETGFGATQGASTVSFNGIIGTPTSWSATTITVPVPSGATTGSVVVTVGGVASNGASFSVTAANVPSISSLSPTSASVGTSVTITGTDFGATQGASTVTFNGTAATPTSWSATTITVPVPSGATTGNVVVTVSGVSSNSASFSVTPPSTPSINSLSLPSGPVQVGVVITGTSFGTSQGSSTVTINGIAMSVSSWSDTSITVQVPTGATTGNVVVTVAGRASNGVSFTVSPSFSCTL